jgi:hypothetical protein
MFNTKAQQQRKIQQTHHEIDTNPMTPEELMKPRYKVIADYPLSRFIIGSIVEGQKGRFDEWFFEINGKELPFDITQYPHLFKKLEWWEERKLEEMPQYVKEFNSLYKIGEVIKVAEWNMGDEEPNIPCFRDETDNSFTWVRGFHPATEEEYNAYITQIT